MQYSANKEYKVDNRMAYYEVNSMSDFIDTISDETYTTVSMYVGDTEVFNSPFECPSEQHAEELMINFLEYGMYPGQNPHDAYHAEVERIRKLLPRTLLPDVEFRVCQQEYIVSHAKCYVSKANPRQHYRQAFWYGEEGMGRELYATVVLSEEYKCSYTGAVKYDSMSLSVSRETAGPLIRSYLATGSIQFRCDGVDFPKDS